MLKDKLEARSINTPSVVTVLEVSVECMRWKHQWISFFYLAGLRSHTLPNRIYSIFLFYLTELRSHSLPNRIYIYICTSAFATAKMMDDVYELNIASIYRSWELNAFSCLFRMASGGRWVSAASSLSPSSSLQWSRPHSTWKWSITSRRPMMAMWNTLIIRLSEWGHSRPWD